MLLLLDGLLVRETRISGRASAELLGAGDVIQPWHRKRLGASPAETWQAIAPGGAALLDELLMARISPYPALTLAVAERAARRGRFLAALALTRRMRRTEERLLLLFALLAERWGRVRSDGIRLSLPLTHELIGELVGAHRQSVTSALGDLEDRALLRRLPERDWLVARSPTNDHVCPTRRRDADVVPRFARGAAMRATLKTFLLDADRELSDALPQPTRKQARAQAVVGTRALSHGPWDAIGAYGAESQWLGLLILSGFVARETLAGQESVLEVIGPGDLLRPWDHDGDYPLPAIRTRWKVLEPAEIALLDEQFVKRAAAWPALITELLERMARRARWLGLRLTISRCPRITVRVAYLFWHLAGRWGRPGGRDLHVPIRLTHEDIAKLIGAHRPSVTAALSRLAQEGFLVRRADGTWGIPLGATDGIEALLRAG